MTVLFLGGCHHAESSQEDTKISLRIVHAPGDVRWKSCMEWVAEQFMERHPEIEVVVYESKNVQGQSYMDRLRVLLAEDEFYDVIELREADTLAEADVLAPLPTTVKDLLMPSYSDWADGYAAPIYTTTLGMIYNQDIFVSLGLSEPQNYEEFLGLCETLNANGINPIAVGGNDLWHMKFWGDYLYDHYIIDERGVICWDRENTEEMLREFRALSEQGFIKRNYMSMSDSQTILEITSGKAAMLYSGPWMLTQMSSLSPETGLGFFFLPGKYERTYAMTDDSASWGISAACLKDERRYEAATAFLEFYYSEGIYEHILVEMNAVSVVSRDLHEMVQSEYQVVLEAYHDGIINRGMFIGDGDTPDGFRTTYNQLLFETLWGDKAIEQLAKELILAWEEGYD